MWLAECREARGWLPALAQKRPVGAYADRHEDIVDIDALVDGPVHAPTVGHGRQSIAMAIMKLDESVPDKSVEALRPMM